MTCVQSGVSAVAVTISQSAKGVTAKNQKTSEVAKSALEKFWDKCSSKETCSHCYQANISQIWVYRKLYVDFDKAVNAFKDVLEKEEQVQSLVKTLNQNESAEFASLRITDNCEKDALINSIATDLCKKFVKQGIFLEKSSVLFTDKLKKILIKDKRVDVFLESIKKKFPAHLANMVEWFKLGQGVREMHLECLQLADKYFTRQDYLHLHKLVRCTLSYEYLQETGAPITVAFNNNQPLTNCNGINPKVLPLIKAIQHLWKESGVCRLHSSSFTAFHAKLGELTLRSLSGSSK